MRFCTVVWTAVVVGLLGGALLLSGCGQKVVAPLPFQVTTTSSGEVITRVALRGRVTDEVTGTPVAGAVVTLGTSAVLTGADGSYTFTNLLPGTYYVTVSKSGYIAGGSGFAVSTSDVLDADLTLTSFAFIPNVEDVRGTTEVAVSEEEGKEGEIVETVTVVSLVPQAGETAEQAEERAAVGLVVEAGVKIKDAAGNVVTEAPALSVTFLDQAQCPSPASGTFGMKPEDVYTKAGTKETATQTVVVEGETVELTAETPNELLTEGTQVQASNVPFAGIVLEANGEQGGTFSEAQKVIVRPEQMTVPVNFVDAGVPTGAQIPFVDSDGEVIFGTLLEDGTIDLEVTKIDTYLMQTNFTINVEDSDVSFQTGAAKPVAPQAVITSETTFEFISTVEIDEATKGRIIDMLLRHLALVDFTSTFINLAVGQEIFPVRTECRIVIVVELPVTGAGGAITLIELFEYIVKITCIDGRVQEIEVIHVVHESGGGIG